MKCESIGAYRPINFGDYCELVSRIELVAGAPKAIRSQFDKARSAFRQSWFDYELTTLAELQAYAAVELALRVRLEADTGKRAAQGLRRLLAEAVARGWVRDSSFRIAPRRRPVCPGGVENSPLDGDQSVSGDPQAYCRVLVEALPHLRNELAHGSSYLNVPSAAHFTLDLCAALINQLFSDATAPISSPI